MLARKPAHASQMNALNLFRPPNSFTQLSSFESWYLPNLTPAALVTHFAQIWWRHRFDLLDFKNDALIKSRLHQLVSIRRHHLDFDTDTLNKKSVEVLSALLRNGARTSPQKSFDFYLEARLLKSRALDLADFIVYDPEVETCYRFSIPDRLWILRSVYYARQRYESQIFGYPIWTIVGWSGYDWYWWAQEKYEEVRKMLKWCLYGVGFVEMHFFLSAVDPGESDLQSSSAALRSTLIELVHQRGPSWLSIASLQMPAPACIFDHA